MEDWLDRLLLNLEGKEQLELSLGQKFELLSSLVERATTQDSEEASTGLMDDATHDVVSDEEKEEGPPLLPNSAPLDSTHPPLACLPPGRMKEAINEGGGVNQSPRGRLGGDLGGSLALKRDILTRLKGEEGGKGAMSSCPSLLSELQNETEELEEDVEEMKEEKEERRFALLSMAIKEDRHSLLERVFFSSLSLLTLLVPIEAGSWKTSSERA